MKHITIEQPNSPGKYRVRIAYRGAENMFGGHDHGKVITKLMTAKQISELKIYPDDTVVNNTFMSNKFFFGE